eukprot:Skav207648  [mRNA]  locus=scaffold2758:61244:65528:+ [translate_table: standard]
MAFTILLGLMMIGAASSETGVAQGAVPSQQNVSEPSRDVLETSSFLHCPCGIDCQKDVGKEHGFDLHQGCGCLSCNLRGATESKPAEGAKAEELLALLAEQEQDWDAASVPGDSQLTFCRCGSLGNSCRSCSPSSQSRSGQLPLWDPVPEATAMVWRGRVVHPAPMHQVPGTQRVTSENQRGHQFWFPRYFTRHSQMCPEVLIALGLNSAL